MKNNLTTDGRELLNKIKLSNLKSDSPFNKTNLQNFNRLKTLSNYKRKIHQNTIYRCFSVTQGNKGPNDGSWNEKKANKQVQKLLSQGQSAHQKSFNQPEFNLRKGTKYFSNNTNIDYQINRKPFTNLNNTKKLKLQRFGNQKTTKFNKIQDIENTLQINRLETNHNYSSSSSTFNKLYEYGQRKTQLNRQNDRAVNNANQVNQIFSYVKRKSYYQQQRIGEFTEIVFKLICYFFIAFMNENSEIGFDKYKMIEFIQKEISQSYKAINSFKKEEVQNQESRKSIFSNQKIADHYGQKTVKPTIRKEKRVSSFFKVVQPEQLQNIYSINSQKSSQNSSKHFTKQKNQSFQIQNSLNQLNIPRDSILNGRKISIAINSIKEDKNQEITDSYSYQNSNCTERQDSVHDINQKKNLFQKIRSSNRRQSCFVNDTSHFQRHNEKKSTYIKHDLKNLNHQNHQNYSPFGSNNSSKQNISYDSKNIKSNSSGLKEINKLPKNSISKQSISKPKLVSNINMNFPYDFLKEDNLMTKRVKYLELHQKIIDMSDSLQELRKQQDQIAKRIDEKDSQLIELEQKLIQIKNIIQQLQIRNKQADNFLNGPQCPQMAQKIIKKKGQIQKNLKSLINYNAWYSSNLAQSSHIQNIISTKQTSLDKLNIMTRKLRGCKDVQQIQSLVSQVRQIFLITVEKYSQIINELQDKIKSTQQSRSNMLKSLEDWEIETKIKQKLVNNSFLDYYSVQRKVSLYVQKLPQCILKLEQYFSLIKQQRAYDQTVNNGPKERRNSLIINSNAQSSTSNIQRQIQNFLKKMKIDNDGVFKQLSKQKRFAMVLERIA